MHFAKLLLLGAGASAHTLFSTLFVDGANEGDATCIRMPDNPSHATDPIRVVTSNDMACGVNGENAVARVCPANGGSILTFEFRMYADGSQAGALDKSHKGPCAVYMKKVDNSAASNNAAGPGWFKVWQEDYDSASGKWCTEKRIMDTNGLLSFQLPNDVESGHYLVRTELLTLQDADKSPADPQFYVGCTQIFLSTQGTNQPKETTSIPGYINMEQNAEALTYHIWEPKLKLPYPMFGPPVYGTSSAKRDIETRDTSQSELNVGLKPANCVLQVGNWCGIELNAYKDEAGCWNATENCWDQARSCYDSAAPTGGYNCEIWENKCKGLQGNCNSGSFSGPPNAGKDLTPPFPKLNLPAPVNVGGAPPKKAVMAAERAAEAPTTLQTNIVAATGAPDTSVSNAGSSRNSQNESPAEDAASNDDDDSCRFD